MGASEPLLNKLDSIDWNALNHAYGSAANLPAVLRIFAFGSDSERQKVLEDEWWGTIVHQGSYYSATAAVVPFLLEIGLASTTPNRHEILDELHWIAMGFIERYCQNCPPVLFGAFRTTQSTYSDDQFVHAAYDSAVSGLPQLRACLLNLADSEPETRISISQLISTFVTQWQNSLLTLLDAWDQEDIPLVRTAILLAISDLLRASVHSPSKISHGYKTVIPRLLEIVQGDVAHTSAEVFAANLCILESGLPSYREDAIQLARHFCECEFEFPQFRIPARNGDSVAGAVYAALWTNPDDQLNFVRWLLQRPNSYRWEECIYLVDLHCRYFRSGKAELIDEIQGLLSDSEYRAHHERLSQTLVGLGESGMNLARQNIHRWAEIAKPLASMEENLRSEQKVCDVEGLPLVPLDTEEELVRAYDLHSKGDQSFDQSEIVMTLGKLPHLSAAGMEVIERAIKQSYRKLRLAGIYAFHNQTQDHARTVQLIVHYWSDDFTSISMLKLLSRCGKAAAHLLPELEAFVASPQRYVRYGWISGNIWLDEKLVSIAQQSIDTLRHRS